MPQWVCDKSVSMSHISTYISPWVVILYFKSDPSCVVKFSSFHRTDLHFRPYCGFLGVITTKYMPPLRNVASVWGYQLHQLLGRALNYSNDLSFLYIVSYAKLVYQCHFYYQRLVWYKVHFIGINRHTWKYFHLFFLVLLTLFHAYLGPIQWPDFACVSFHYLMVK